VAFWELSSQSAAASETTSLYHYEISLDASDGRCHGGPITSRYGPQIQRQMVVQIRRLHNAHCQESASCRLKTSSSAIAERPRVASCHWIFC